MRFFRVHAIGSLGEGPCTSARHYPTMWNNLPSVMTEIMDQGLWGDLKPFPVSAGVCATTLRQFPRWWSDEDITEVYQRGCVLSLVESPVFVKLKYQSFLFYNKTTILRSFNKRQAATLLLRAKHKAPGASQ